MKRAIHVLSEDPLPLSHPEDGTNFWESQISMTPKTHEGPQQVRSMSQDLRYPPPQRLESMDVRHSDFFIVPKKYPEQGYA